MTEQEQEVECGGIHCRTCEFEDDCGFQYREDECPATCPRCDHNDIKHKPQEPYDRDMISVDWECLKCGFEWVEIYTFSVWRRND